MIWLIGALLLLGVAGIVFLGWAVCRMAAMSDEDSGWYD